MTDRPPPTLDIVIVNWNAGAQLRACLESLAGASREGFRLERVAVVDNGSADGSGEGLGDLPLPLEVIRNVENRGFAGACNQGARSSRAGYLLFLNPDTLLFPSSLAVPLAFMEDSGNGRVGICGVQVVGEGGVVVRTCARFATPARFWVEMLGLERLLPGRFEGIFLRGWDHDRSRRVDHVVGAFYLVRRTLYEALGGFDERFFLYLEDLDFSYRAHRAGWETRFLAEARVYHKGGGTTEGIRARRLAYALRSRILYSAKHFSRVGAAEVVLGTLLVEPLTRLAHAALRRSAGQVAETVAGYGLLWRWAPSWIAGGRSGKR